MKWSTALRIVLAAAVLCMGLCAFPPPARAEEKSGLPGSEAWQPYLEQSPIEPELFAASPVEALKSLLPSSISGTLRTAVQSYANVLLFLLLAAALAFLTANTSGGEMLDLAAASGCSILLWSELVTGAQMLCEKIEGWQTFLLGFLPVYAGVLTAGGESAAAASVNGLLLTALCFLAQAAGAWLVPLLQCYLALSVTCCLAVQPGLAAACKGMGRLLRQGLGFLGKAFVLLLGIQRVFTLQIDNSALRIGRMLTSTVPVIGQTLSDAAGTVLAGMQMLKSSLGMAALCILGAEFAPVYFSLMVQCVLLAGCGLLCAFAELKRCKMLFDCLLQAVQCMAAAVALFFGIVFFGTILMFAAGGG